MLTKPISNGKKDIQSLKRVLGMVWKYYPHFIFISVTGILISAYATVNGTAFIQRLVDFYIMPLLGQENPDYIPLLKALQKVAMIYFMGVLGSYFSARVMVNVGQGSMQRLRKELFTHMERLPIPYFDTHAHGDIMSVYTNDIATLREAIGSSLPQFLNSIVSVFSIAFTMWILNAPLTILALFMVGVMLFVSKEVAGKSGKFFMQQQQSLGKLNGYAEEMMSGQKVVKVFCHEQKAVEDFIKYNEELRKNSYQANRFANILMPIIMQIGNLNYVICAIVGGIIAVNGMFGITIGTIVAFLTLLRGFNHPFAQISQQLNNIVRAAAGASRVYEIMDTEIEQDQGYITLVYADIVDGKVIESKERTGKWAWKHIHKEDKSITYTLLEGDIVLEGVDFGYTSEKKVLHNIHLYAHKGQKVAFVGSTGAGKTTITNLLNRFYDIQAGKIRYDGINITKIRKSDLRKSLGIVLQDTHLFTGSIMENIRYGRADATDQECVEAAELANASGFIELLPQGYDTIIQGDGGKLSQGQKQLLAIARAAVADPPVLILDEATSSIDTRTEQLVQKGMDALMKGRTSFVIAHRLSTVKNADCIMVLEQGHIIERGSHQELLEQKGKYYHLYMGIDTIKG